MSRVGREGGGEEGERGRRQRELEGEGRGGRGYLASIDFPLQISLLKKGLRQQAEGVLTLSGHCQQLYAAQMQLIDLLPDSPPPVVDEAASREREGRNVT